MIMRKKDITFLGGSKLGQPSGGGLDVSRDGEIVEETDPGLDRPEVVGDVVDEMEGIVVGHGPWNRSISHLSLQSA